MPVSLTTAVSLHLPLVSLFIMDKKKQVFNFTFSKLKAFIMLVEVKILPIRGMGNLKLAA